MATCPDCQVRLGEVRDYDVWLCDFHAYAQARIEKLEAELKEADALLRDYGTDADGILYRAVREFMERRRERT